MVKRHIADLSFGATSIRTRAYVSQHVTSNFTSRHAEVLLQRASPACSLKIVETRLLYKLT